MQRIHHGTAYQPKQGQQAEGSSRNEDRVNDNLLNTAAFLHRELHLAFIEYPGFRRAEEYDRDQKHDDEQNPRNGGCLPHFPELKGLPINIVVIKQAGIVGPSLRHNQRLGKYLEGSDRSHDQIKEDNWRHHGNRNMPEFPECAGTVHNGRLIQGSRHPLQACKENDDGAPHPPKAHHHNRRHHRLFGIQPVERRQIQCFKKAVEQSQIRTKQPEPDHGRGDRRHDGRQIKDRTKDGFAANELHVQQKSSHKGEHKTKRNTENDVFQGDP